jgi:hypothetical protein
MPNSIILAINITSDVVGSTSLTMNLRRNDNVGPEARVMVGLNDGSIVSEVRNTSLPVSEPFTNFLQL